MRYDLDRIVHLHHHLADDPKNEKKSPRGTRTTRKRIGRLLLLWRRIEMVMVLLHCLVDLRWSARRRSTYFFHDTHLSSYHRHP